MLYYICIQTWVFLSVLLFMFIDVDFNFLFFFLYFLGDVYIDPPVFKHAPQSVDADEKEVVKMSCDADGNPLEIVWVHDPIDRVSNNFTYLFCRFSFYLFIYLFL